MIGRHANRGSLRLRNTPVAVQTKPQKSRGFSPAITIAVAVHLVLLVGLAVWKLPLILRAAPTLNEPLTATITFTGMREIDNDGGTGGGNLRAGGRGSEMPKRSLLAAKPKLPMPPLPQPKTQLLPVIAVKMPEIVQVADYQSSAPSSLASVDTATSHGFGNGTGSGVGDGNIEGVAGNSHGTGTGEGSGAGIGFGSANYLRSPEPHYPSLAREKGWEGAAILRVEIQADGLVGAISITQSTGHQVLDEAAINAVREARFQPARLEGVAIVSWVEIPITFRLNRG